MLMAFLNSGEFATLANSAGNLSLAALNIFFILPGDRACLVYVLPLYFLTPPTRLELANSFLLNMPSINLNTEPLNLLNWQQGNWPIVGGKWGVPFIQQVGRIRMIRRFPQRTRTCISAHLPWATGATRRTSSKITESGLDLGGKRGRHAFWWGVLIIPCIKWSKVITIIQAETWIFIDTMWVRTVWRWISEILWEEGGVITGVDVQLTIV